MTRRAPRFFATPADWRAWLASNHASAGELWVGYYKKATGKASITWPESVDEALCYGWIDGIRKSIDDSCYMIRFTPRRPGSLWSAVNTKRARELITMKRMRAAGLRAFEKRDEERSAVRSFDRHRVAKLPPAYLRAFKANVEAWRFFERRPPSYQRRAIFWVISAAREETRLKRLDKIIADSARGRG